MLILYPVEGIGNRMRAIDSALRYCSDAGTKCIVRWYLDRNLLNCGWEELFHHRDGISEAGRDYDMLQFLYKGRRHSSLFRGFLYFLKKLHLLVICGPDDWAELREVTASGKHYLCIIAQTFSIFYWPESEGFKREEFVLNEDLKSRVEKLTADFGTNTVGVHIRRTDNRDSIARSPLSLFEKEISEGIAKGMRYYVCSDDESVKCALVREFGESHIIVSSGVVSRNCVEGIRQAVVELFALSKTKYILGSYYSSFSEMASYLGGIELRILMQ